MRLFRLQTEDLRQKTLDKRRWTLHWTFDIRNETKDIEFECFLQKKLIFHLLSLISYISLFIFAP